MIHSSTNQELKASTQRTIVTFQPVSITKPHLARPPERTPMQPAHPRSACRAPLATREPRSQLLGGFAGRTSLKRCNTPVFPQVGEADNEQTPPKTAQKPRTHDEIGAHFLRNRPEGEGGAPAGGRGIGKLPDFSQSRWKKSESFLVPVRLFWRSRHIAECVLRASTSDTPTTAIRFLGHCYQVFNQGRKKERSACQEWSACRRRIIHHAPAEPFQ